MSAADKSTRQIMIVAGEASGDLHGSQLIHAAAEYPWMNFYGVGGRRMEDAGCRLLFAADELTVMGIWEVVGRLAKIWRRFRQLKAGLLGSQAPDLLILIDFPDFNLRLAEVARRAGVPVLYYISPKVWAWRPARARTLAERVDRLALIFPFEEEIYRHLPVRAEYVGNPLLDDFAELPPADDLRARFGLNESDQVVGIYPGSRQSELDNIWPTLMDTARLLRVQRPECKFLLPVAPSFDSAAMAERLAAAPVPIQAVEGDIYAVSAVCNAALCVSGTVTLQLALTATPMAIVYKVAPLSYAIGRRLIRVSWVSLVNIVAGREVVREFIQHEAVPEVLCTELLSLLEDPAYRQQIQDGLGEVRQRLGGPGCSTRVAAIAAEMLS